MRLPRTVLAPFVLLAFALSACSGSSSVPQSDIVSTIPWPASERLTYAVKDRKGATLGESILSVLAQGETTNLSQNFSGQSTRDNTTVVVDSKTLKPKSSQREIVTPSDDTTIEVTYTDQGASIKQGDKQSGLSVPEHAYDNDSSLFLWRTIAFAPDYEASYITIITNRRSKETVTLHVTGKENVKVAAGEFPCWRLEIKAGGVTQTAWYADIPAHPLIRYDNGNGDSRVIYELQSNPGVGQASVAR